MTSQAFEPESIGGHGRDGRGSPRPPLPIAGRAPAPGDVRPATPGQQRFWFLEEYEGDASVLEIRRVFWLSRPAGVAVLRRAIDAVAARHPVLALRFDMTREGLRFTATGEAPEVVEVALDHTLNPSALTDRRRRRATLDPNHGPTLRVELGVRNEHCQLIGVELHPCVGDARTVELLVAEIVGGDPEAEPTPDDHFFAAGVGQGRPDQGSLEHWRRRLDGAPLELDLPSFARRPLRKRFEAARIVRPLGDGARPGIETRARGIGTTPATLGLGVYMLLLERWTQADTIVVGRSIDLRPADAPKALGPFENLLPVHLHFEAGETFEQYLARLAWVLAEDDRHRDLAFEHIVRACQPTPDASRAPIFQALFRYEDAPRAPTSSETGLTELAHGRISSPFDIELLLSVGERDVCAVTFDSLLYDNEMMERFIDQFARLLEDSLTSPERNVDMLGSLSPEETCTQLCTFNPPPGVTTPVRAGTDADRNVLAACRRALEDCRDRPALSFAGTTLTHAELERLSNRLARVLRRHGVSRGTVVGVCLDRSLDMVATVLGVLEAGGAYVPMDPAYPKDRLAMMVEDADASLIVVHARHAGRLPEDARTMVYETVASELAQEPDDPLPLVAGGDDLAYVIFTSGSTGRPKGVAMPHGALVNLVDWQLARRSFRPGARVLQYSSLSFDVSFQEILSTLASGGHLFLIADEDRRDPRVLLRVLDEQRIERLFLPYVALRQLVDVAQSTGRYPAALEEVITAGEQLRVDDPLRRFFDRLGRGRTLDNQYGPSETHVITAYLLAGPAHRWPDLPPLGRPLPNNRAYVLGKRRQLLPIGATGELYLAGANLARGYLGREDLTRAQFVDDPFAVGSVMYRTGDLARYRPDGNIEFLGRTDHQVKVRGHRIEPGEINGVLGRFPEVRQCLTRDYHDERFGTRLASYVLVDDAERFPLAALRQKAREVLPAYMVPAAIIPMTAFPFTPSGKVDLRALPEPGKQPAEDGAVVPAATETQSALAELWCELLGIERIGITDSFFEHGGDSLAAVTLFLEIEMRFGVELPLAVLAEHPTIAALAELIDNGTGDSSTAYQCLRRIQRGRPDQTPLFLVHGGGGNVILFRDLARNISRDLPVYAFQWRGWNGGSGETSIAAMAEAYKSELLTAWPRGPYRIGGHCVGGVIALELARRLRAEGHEVIEPLIITDAPNAQATSYHRRAPRKGSRDERQLEAVHREVAFSMADCPTHTPPPTAAKSRRELRPPTRLIRRLNRMLRREPFKAEGVEKALDRIEVVLRQAFGRRIPMNLRQQYCAMSMIRAVRAFEPGHYPYDVLLIRAEVYGGSEMGLPGWWSDPYLGFGELVGGRFAATFIKATHNGVISHPRTAEIVRRAMHDRSRHDVAP